MSSATASFRAGRFAEAPYMAQAERFWRQLGVNPAGQQPFAPASPGASAPAPPAQPGRPRQISRSRPAATRGCG